MLSILIPLSLSLHPVLAQDAFKLVLDENFDAPELDSKIWNIETGKRGESMNSPLAVDLKDGCLKVSTFTDENGVTYCGFVTTRKKFTVSQGKIEARCRFNMQLGTQSAFWATSGSTGRSNSNEPEMVWKDGVEIDVLETTGKMKGTYQYALHWGGYGPHHKGIGNKFSENVGAEWHVFGCEWDKDGYRFTRDGEVVAIEKRCPPTEALLFLLITTECKDTGGWAGAIPKEGYGPKDTSNNWLEVDWVKAWERVPTAEGQK